MSHIRIVCRGPRRQGSIMIYPSGRDAKVFVVDDAGVETDISKNVDFVSWSAGATTEAVVTLSLVGAEIDAVGTLGPPIVPEDGAKKEGDAA